MKKTLLALALVGLTYGAFAQQTPSSSKGQTSTKKEVTQKSDKKKTRKSAAMPKKSETSKSEPKKNK